MAQQTNPNDATGMMKIGAIALIALILLIVGSCSMVRCACGGKELFTYYCVKRNDPKIKCPGEWSTEFKKAAPPNCHGAPMVPKK